MFIILRSYKESNEIINVNIIGNKVEDRCYPIGKNIDAFATMTRNQCLKTCESRTIQGCEFRADNNAECIFHTKYIIGARNEQPKDGKYTCFRFERGIKIFSTTK